MSLMNRMKGNNHRSKAAMHEAHAQNWNAVAKVTTGGLKKHAQAHAAHSMHMAGSEALKARAHGVTPKKGDVFAARTNSVLSGGIAGFAGARVAHHLTNAAKFR